MADLALTAAQIALAFPTDPSTRVRNRIAANTITSGQALYQNSSGQVDVADASSAGKQQFRGIALNPGNAGDVIAVLEQGEVTGFTITQAYDALIYLDTTGQLADTANGTKTVVVGRVKALSDKPNYTKVIMIQESIVSNW